MRPKPALPDQLWGVDGLAAYLGVPKSHVYLLTSQRRIAFCKVGRELRFTPEAVADYIADIQQPPVRPAPVGSPNPSSSGGRPRATDRRLA